MASCLCNLVVVALAIMSLVAGAPLPRPTSSLSSLNTRKLDTRGYRSVGYFTDWKIYAPTPYFPNQLPAQDLTHVLFSFAAIKPDGTVFMNDTWADFEINKNYSEPGNNVYGCAKELFELKKNNRNTKVLISVGGFTASQNTDFSIIATSEAGRKKFAATSIKLLQDIGLDGIDIDWEFPKTDAEAKGYVLLLAELRKALDEYSMERDDNYHFEITIASSAGPPVYNRMLLKEMDQYIDAWHLMFYDYSGQWSSVSGHLSNLYPSVTNPASTDYSTDQAIRDHLVAGIPSHKLVLGVPLYGRAFKDTEGMGKKFTKYTQAGSDEYAISDLPKEGSTVYHDQTVGAAYSYDPITHELISFDTPQETLQKAVYIKTHNLGGAMYWEISQDKTGSDSLVHNMVNDLGRANIQQYQNLLSYPESQYDNIKAGLPQ